MNELTDAAPGGAVHFLPSARHLTVTMGRRGQMSAGREAAIHEGNQNAKVAPSAGPVKCRSSLSSSK